MTWLAFLWSLTFVAPSTNSRLVGSCPLGCRDTTAGAGTLTDLAGFYVIRHRQSPSWLAHRADIIASPDSAARWWPVVRAEAAWRGYVFVPCQPSAAGQAQAITVADTTHGWFYGVCSQDQSGNLSCMSKEVAR
jgi:hypothetical protein